MKAEGRSSGWACGWNRDKLQADCGETELQRSKDAKHLCITAKGSLFLEPHFVQFLILPTFFLSQGTNMV